ncbi:MAG: hypothetical protein JRI68_04330 [Deltaproteobacteria bacterium]|nr:hypothetical protein [Deltaproteobacteria bacterium]
MTRRSAVCVLLGAGALVGCGSEPEPYVPGPTAPPRPNLVPITLPDCDPTAEGVRLIETDEDWNGINDPDVRVHCVAAGDYRGVGTIRLEADGEPGLERWIRFYDPDDPDGELHPAQRAENERAIIDTLRFQDASHWRVHGITVTGDWTVVRLDEGSEYNVLDRLLVDTAAVWFGHGAHNNSLQHSVVRNAPLSPGGDRVCVVLSGSNDGADVAIHGTRIVGNEIYDCTDSIQLYRPDDSTHAIDFGDTVIDDNDMFLTEAMYSDCNGTLDPQGDCACAENAVDIKAAGTWSQNIVQVSNNRMWGFKPTDTACGGTGSGGTASVVHFTARYTLHQGNIIWDSPAGVTVLNDQHSVVDNVIAQILDPPNDRGTAIYAEASGTEVYRNIIVNVHDWAAVVGNSGDYRCNTLIAAGDHRGSPGNGVIADYNWYYEAEQLALPGEHDIVSDQAADAQHTDLCFQVRRFTSPQEVCLPQAAPTEASPHHGACDPNLGQRPGVGVDNRTW